MSKWWEGVEIQKPGNFLGGEVKQGGFLSRPKEVFGGISHPTPHAETGGGAHAEAGGTALVKHGVAVMRVAAALQAGARPARLPSLLPPPGGRGHGFA